MSHESRIPQILPEGARAARPAGTRAPGARTAPAWTPGADFLRLHALWPLLAFVVLATLAMAGQGDAWIADRLYAWEGGRWALREAWTTQQLIHLGGRDLSALAWLLAFAAWMVACLRPGAARLRRPLAYLLVATLASTATVALLKGVTAMDCPWDLARYGGHLPAVGLFELRPSGMPAAACFPAGHASGGYAWVASYFFLGVVQPRMRYWGLAFGLGLGLVFGVGQQLRGAHFASHDLWTAAICWFVALGAYRLFWPSRTAAQGATR
ncbi:phosphatase PAP2 family protein [Marilutibacter spongiae]|uniref:Phosphatase PAP2 family protein n=1 Tax=Marilutibacter spongiae TaxID=2025720 RepID=A0A7W3Y5A9_9GAMM|nr:phosphatase PAP2 family protein [Lysobacter spongiae]MBB1060017.1 phosphatase PAP2 family protein [Lysobacter spongiae]